ncbi:MAG: efflux RND transporter periplasmic adaptor subunit [Burkholderiales bacterium]
MNRKRVICLGASALILSTLLACSGEKKQVQVGRESAPNLALVKVQTTTTPDAIESTGTVKAAESAQLSAQVLASVIAVNVREGDRVRKGQTLVVLDDAQLRAATDRASAAVAVAEKEMAAANANYMLTEATLKRYQTLFDKKSASPQEFDEVKARYSAAQAQLEAAHGEEAQARAALSEAKTMQSYTRLLAPFDGVITEKHVDSGGVASPGMPLLTLESTGHYRLEANVNEMDIAAVHVGMTAPVTIESVATQPIEARVAQIVPAADSASRSFVVKLDLPAVPNLRSGLFGRVSIPKGNRRSMFIPRTAILDRGQLQAVYVIGNDQVVNLRYVTLGRPRDNGVEVLSGIEPGEELVADPGERDLSGKIAGVKQ